MNKLVECVPNFSEGRRPEVVSRILDAITSVAGVRLLDHSSDASHNRTVVTFLGDPASAKESALPDGFDSLTPFWKRLIMEKPIKSQT